MAELGSRYKLGFLGDYSGGVWQSTVSTDRIGQSNSGRQPTLGETPGGNPVLVLDGNDLLVPSGFSDGNVLSALAAFPAVGNRQRLFACVFRQDEILSDTYATLLYDGETSIMINPYASVLYIDSNLSGYVSMISDVEVSDGEWHPRGRPMAPRRSGA